jgi:hypothetical protein
MFGEEFKKDPWGKGARSKKLIDKLTDERTKSVSFDLEDSYDMPLEEMIPDDKLDLWSPSEEWASPPPIDYSDYIFGEGVKKEPNFLEKLFGGGEDIKEIQRQGKFGRENKSDLLKQLQAQEKEGKVSSAWEQYYGSGQPPAEELLYEEPTGAFEFQEGGKVPEYYGGGSVEGEGTTPTIVDYFSRQGKTLGGSNTQSLSEMLGRK